MPAGVDLIMHLWRARHKQRVGRLLAPKEALVGADGARPSARQQFGKEAAGSCALSWHAAARQLAQLLHRVALTHQPLVLPAACKHATAIEVCAFHSFDIAITWWSPQPQWPESTRNVALYIVGEMFWHKGLCYNNKHL